jgi:MFS transporter, Spinster family, sphingosine-1-phosphate transporter
MNRRYPWLVVALLWIVATVNYTDRQVVYSVFPLIKADLKLSDFQLGLLSAAFIWVYGLVSPFAGYLADRWGHARAIVASLFVWSAVTWLTGHAHSFHSLFSIRAAMGLSEACYLPAALALIAELHHGRSVSLATGLHQSGIYTGIVIGGLGGGWVGQHYGWRLGFTALGIFGVCYAVALVPVLTKASSHVRQSRGISNFFSTLKELLAIRGFLSVVVAFSAFSMANWVAYTWLPVYFYEHFSVNLAVAGFSATFYLQLASVIGVVTGGWLADRWMRRRKRARLLIQAIGALAASPCLFWAGFTSSEIVLVLNLIMFGLGKGFYDANTMPVLCQIARSEIRATGYGIMNFAGCLVGGTAAAAAGLVKHTFGIGAVFELAGALLLGAMLLLSRIRPVED